jgi:hypothetical protein
MKNPNKIKLIKLVKKEIKKDWGRCPAKHLTWQCMSCLAGLVIDFLDNWVDLIKQDKQ